MGRKRTTLADAVAAAAMAGQDPATITLATDDGEPDTQAATVGLPGDHHACGISGCTHGATHGDGYRPQPDRQLKLSAPCGAVARMTARALGNAGGTITCAHGDPFTMATRRTYNRKAGN